LGRELPSVRWRDRFDRPKVARYWVLVPAAGSEAVGTNEVDAVEWLPLPDALERLSYERDAVVLRSITENDLPPHSAGGPHAAGADPRP
jgi:8-oxo-dGTP diphosphatase